jgi:hypothetical protein
MAFLKSSLEQRSSCLDVRNREATTHAVILLNCLRQKGRDVALLINSLGKKGRDVGLLINS